MHLFSRSAVCSLKSRPCSTTGPSSTGRQNDERPSPPKFPCWDVLSSLVFLSRVHGNLGDATSGKRLNRVQPPCSDSVLLSAALNRPEASDPELAAPLRGQIVPHCPTLEAKISTQTLILPPYFAPSCEAATRALRFLPFPPIPPTMAAKQEEGLFARQYIDYIYVPAGLLVVGTAIVKMDWTPYAVLLAVALGVWNYYSFQLKKVLKPDVFQEFPLQEKTIISHNVAIYRFKLPTPRSILGLPIGQHISIGAHLPQPDGTVKEIVRSYTPISGDHQPGFVDLLIKSYPQGNISKHMASLQVGQTIRVRGPKGAFVYTPNMVRHFGMVAGGTGITPMLQVIRAIVRGRAAGDKTEVDLIFANVTAQDILLKEDLDALAKEDSGIRIHYVLDKPPEGWTGGVGFVTAEMINNWLPKPAPDVKILLCGPPPMISGLKKATESLGFAKARPVSKLEDQVFAF
ncbi:hypothetical protein TgHK011_000864 [Trichoderma gracile]|nr:hypothetical protein TgHK011_000864 [Trichoderma gracile]